MSPGSWVHVASGSGAVQSRGWGPQRGWRRTNRGSRVLTSNPGGLAAAKRQRDINRKRLPILVDNLIEGCECIFCPFHPQDHLGSGKRRGRIIVCCFAVVLHIDEEPRKVLDLGWEKLDVTLFHALILDIPVTYCTVGLNLGWLASCGPRFCCQGIGHAPCQSVEQRVVDRTDSPL